MEYSIYVNREDIQDVEREECNNFIRAVIEAIGLDIDDIWEDGTELDAATKLRLRDYLNKFSIEIIYDGDRGYKIYVDDDCVGEWFKPRVVLKKDIKARTLSKQLFYELSIKYSSLFEEDEEEDEE